MRNISDTIARLAALRARSATGPTPGVTDRLSDLTGFGSNPGALRARAYVPEICGRARPWWSCCTAARRPLPAMTMAPAGLDLRTDTASRCSFPSSSGQTIPISASTGSCPSDIRRGQRRGSFDPPDDRGAGHRARPRPQAYLRHRPFGRRRHDVRHARHLSGSFRRRRDHRRSSLWLAATIPEAFDRMRGHGGPAEARRFVCSATPPATTDRGRRSRSGMARRPSVSPQYRAHHRAMAGASWREGEPHAERFRRRLRSAGLVQR